jgi:hypothetical protein
MNNEWRARQARKNRNRSIGCAGVVIFIVVFLIFPFSSPEKEAFRAAEAANEWGSYERFLSEYPDSKYQSEVYSLLYELARGDGRALIRLGQGYPEVLEMHSGVFKDAYRMLYGEAFAQNTEEGWDAFLGTINGLPEVDEYVESGMRRKLEFVFLSDKKAWAFVSSNASIDLCERYLAAFPKGEHWRECEKMLIDLQIEAVFFSGEYDQLPASEKTGRAANGREYSVLMVANDTRYEMSVLYGGSVESKRVVISPWASERVRLPNGTYRTVASVRSALVRNYAGRDTLMGGNYEMRFYIR